MMPSTEFNDPAVDLVVIGGGLAGLATAALVARGGRSVLVLERSRHLGGRALTQEKQGIHFNLGAHALYRAGHAFRIFTALDVPFTGRIPNSGRPLLLDENASYGLPRGLRSLVASRLLTIREKWTLARLLAALPTLDTTPLDRIPLRDWIGRNAGSGQLARLLGALFRVSTYADDPDRMSAGAAVDQLRLGLAGNVWYLDGGWQTLVDGLSARATACGAEVRTSAPAEQIGAVGEGVRVRLADGSVVHARTAVLAVPPQEAAALLELPDDAPLARWGASAHPVQAACFDVALSRLPRPERRFALGLDEPTYYSVHSATAKLAPEGIAVVHVMKYLGGGVKQPAERVEATLEAVLDRLQPGWREHVIEQRFLPVMSVASALPTATDGGLSGRQGVALAGLPRVFLAGDWVGSRGMLADAAAASAEEAADRVLRELALAPRQPAGSPAHAGS